MKKIYRVSDWGEGGALRGWERVRGLGTGEIVEQPGGCERVRG